MNDTHESPPLPDLTNRLLDALEERFPDRMQLDPSISEAERWLRAGEVRLIRLLRRELEQGSGRIL